MKLLGEGKDLRIGRISKWLSPHGLGGCLRCKTTWAWVSEHVTQYTAGASCFPLCEQCWKELSSRDRLPYYERLWEIWMEQGAAKAEDVWVQIETAVMLGN